MRTFTLLICVFILGINMAGCVSAGVGVSCSWQSQMGDSSTLYLADKSSRDQAFRLYQFEYKDEMSKVHYLINCIRFSKNSFKRNGKKYTGNQAAQWLEYKVKKFRDEIKTAEDFIEKIGCYSRTSGKQYYIGYANGVCVPIKSVYYNELRALDVFK